MKFASRGRDTFSHKQMNGAALTQHKQALNIKTHTHREHYFASAHLSLSLFYLLRERFWEILFHPDAVWYAAAERVRADGKKASSAFPFACILLFTRHMKGYISSHTLLWGCIRHEGRRTDQWEDQHGQLRKGPINKNTHVYICSACNACIFCAKGYFPEQHQPLPPLLLAAFSLRNSLPLMRKLLLLRILHPLYSPCSQHLI